MSVSKEYEVEIELEGRIHISVEANSAEEAKAKAERYNPSAQEVRDGVHTFNVDPWGNLSD